MEVDVVRCLSRRERHDNVPCKLNNVKMTFITLDKLRFV